MLMDYDASLRAGIFSPQQRNVSPSSRRWRNSN